MTVADMATVSSISVLASFASAFLCLLVVGIKWASAVKRDLAGEENTVNASRLVCARCGTSFFDNVQLGLKDVLCEDCKRPVCSACALRYPTIWLCTACIKSRDEDMVLGDLLLKDLRYRFPVVEPSSKRYGKRENDVRDLIEMLVQNILGISFENIKVNSVSNDITYLEFMDKYEGVLSLTLLRLKISIQLIIDGVASVINDSPSSIELQLRGLIRDIIEDAACIEFAKMSEIKTNTCNIASKTYEDILAIAILNKIIENVVVVPAVEGPTPRALLSHEAQSHISLGLRENSDFERHHPANTKLESQIRKLRTYTSSKNYWNKYKVSLPDLGWELPRDNISELKTWRWEENWLFRRKKAELLCSAATSDYKRRSTVPMFVPSPNIHISPKIGEDCVEDISDLSDLSDSEIERLIQT